MGAGKCVLSDKWKPGRAETRRELADNERVGEFSPSRYCIFKTNGRRTKRTARSTKFLPRLGWYATGAACAIMPLARDLTRPSFPRYGKPGDMRARLARPKTNPTAWSRPERSGSATARTSGPAAAFPDRCFPLPASSSLPTASCWKRQASALLSAAPGSS